MINLAYVDSGHVHRERINAEKVKLTDHALNQIQCKSAEVLRKEVSTSIKSIVPRNVHLYKADEFHYIYEMNSNKIFY